jgi:hypothetical protein
VLKWTPGQRKPTVRYEVQSCGKPDDHPFRLVSRKLGGGIDRLNRVLKWDAKNNPWGW